MTTLRIILARNNNVVRLAVWLLAVHCLLPTQMVWCNEDDAAPRMELAVNGQCLAGSSHGCCTGDQGLARDNTRGGTPGTAIANANGHNHCVDCSDELILQSPAVTPGLSQVGMDRCATGGCLFSISQAGIQGNPSLGEPVWQPDRQRMPGQYLLHSLTTSLLI